MKVYYLSKRWRLKLLIIGILFLNSFGNQCYAQEDKDFPQATTVLREKYGKSIETERGNGKIVIWFRQADRQPYQQITQVLGKMRETREIIMDNSTSLYISQQAESFISTVRDIFSQDREVSPELIKIYNRGIDVGFSLLFQNNIEGVPIYDSYDSLIVKENGRPVILEISDIPEGIKIVKDGENRLEISEVYSLIV